MNEHSFKGVYFKVGVLLVVAAELRQEKEFALFSTGTPFG